MVRPQRKLFVRNVSFVFVPNSTEHCANRFSLFRTVVSGEAKGNGYLQAALEMTEPDQRVEALGRLLIDSEEWVPFSRTSGNIYSVAGTWRAGDVLVFEQQLRETTTDFKAVRNLATEPFEVEVIACV